MAPLGKKASKPVFKTDIPFTETKWPKISVPDQDIILDLVCNLIQPLGLHRTSHLAPSKGKKRKRKTSNTSKDIDMHDTPPPPIGEHLLIGLNSVTRHLDALAATQAPSPLQAKQAEPVPKSTDPTNPPPSKDQDPSTATQTTETTTKPVSTFAKVAVLILPTTTPQTSLAHSHLPTLLYLSSLTSTKKLETSTHSTTTPSISPRLVLLPPASETRLAAALGIPRVGALAVLENAPGAETLVSYCREKVGEVECAWIEEGLHPSWTGLKGGY